VRHVARKLRTVSRTEMENAKLNEQLGGHGVDESVIVTIIPAEYTST